ncbi:MAG: hypothetical protein JRJ09_12405 [Deltaproteobacteria bacterium]|nr:hypothetical protein [Deltaproteobacteria bacterium]MBW2049309.1 hypothetical protein [Deltaproteobacteria bacterium]MBW2110075.1 hypothetical protein [Deltaproteobacteria bacterium]MBW2352958.1 hypothetical protein [Deltaproteobacteria bacterium]HDZ91644.1 hypothetical protein [Deltaproteobacteria bacterium]
MGKRLRIAVFMCGIFLIIWPGEVGAQKKRSVNQRILEILIEKGIITENQYQGPVEAGKGGRISEGKSSREGGKERKNQRQPQDSKATRTEVRTLRCTISSG